MLRTSVTWVLQDLEEPWCFPGLSIPEGLHCGIIPQSQVSYSSKDGKTPWQAMLLQARYLGSTRSSLTEMGKASTFLNLTVGDLLL